MCFRCDWEGTADRACPRCGAPLYRAAPTATAPPTTLPSEPETESASAAPASPAVWAAAGKAPVGSKSEAAPAPSTTADPRPAAAPRPARPPADRQPMTPTIEGEEEPHRRTQRRPLPRGVRWVAAAAALLLLAGVVWTRNHSELPPSRSLARDLQGTFVYASEGEDGATSRLWRVNVAKGTADEGPRTLLPDEIVPAGPGGSWVGVRSGGSAYVYRDLGPGGAPELLAEGQLVAWAPGGNAVFLVTRDPSPAGCPTLRISFVDALAHGSADLYDAPTCSVADGLAIDGLTRPFVSLAGRRDSGVYELGYKTLHQVVPDYALLGVSPVGDMLVGPRVNAPTGPADGSSPVLRTLLVWQGVGGPTIIGNARDDLRAERFLAWSHNGDRAAILGTLGSVRSIWLVDIKPGAGRRRPVRVAPELPQQVGSVGATFARDALFVTAAGKLYASTGRGFREVHLPDGAPPPSGPILWLDH